MNKSERIQPACPLGKHRRGSCSTPWSTPPRRSTGTWTRGPEEWPLGLGSSLARHTPPAADWTRPCRDSGPPRRPSCVLLRTSSFCKPAECVKSEKHKTTKAHIKQSDSFTLVYRNLNKLNVLAWQRFFQTHVNHFSPLALHKWRELVIAFRTIADLFNWDWWVKHNTTCCPIISPGQKAVWSGNQMRL